MLFSIVTINYNNKEGLQKTIESVISQTCSDYEHIIIDGGSTDGSAEVIKNALQNASYAKHVSYWCSEKDSGVYDAMNKGIRRARGELIATLNSGDSYFPDTIENLVQVHKENPNAILYGAIKYVKNDEFISIGWSRACDLPDHMIPHPASFVPRSIYEKYGLYDESFKSSGDYDLFLKFYFANVEFIFINKITTCFEIGGMSETNTKLVLNEDLRIAKKYKLYKKQNKLILKKIKHFIKFILRK